MLCMHFTQRVRELCSAWMKIITNTQLFPWILNVAGFLSCDEYNLIATMSEHSIIPTLFLSILHFAFNALTLLRCMRRLITAGILCQWLYVSVCLYVWYVIRYRKCVITYDQWSVSLENLQVFSRCLCRRILLNSVGLQLSMESKHSIVSLFYKENLHERTMKKRCILRDV